MSWFQEMESKAGTEINPIVGICCVCSKKIYRHELALGATKSNCGGMCRENELKQVLKEFYKLNKLRMVEG